MILTMTIWKLLLWCLISFILGYFVVYITITQPKHKDGFEVFYVFKKVGLVSLFTKIFGDKK